MKSYTEYMVLIKRQNKWVYSFPFSFYKSLEEAEDRMERRKKAEPEAELKIMSRKVTVTEWKEVQA